MPETLNADRVFFYLRAVVLFALCLFTTFSFAKAQQKDTVATHAQSGDTATIRATAMTHSPSKAVLYSALLPGLGQAYNHKYWKIPIIYVGLGAMAYFIVHNQQQYNTYESALKTRSNGGTDPYYNTYSSSDLVTIRDSYHRYRDLSVIGATVIYVLNIVDADVDAQMFTFNVSDDISMRVVPVINTYSFSSNLHIAPALSYVVTFK